MDLGLRVYDPRTAKMFSIDPKASEYPWQSSYVYHRNSPIKIIDFLGGGDSEFIINKDGKNEKISNKGGNEGLDFIHLEDNKTIVEDKKTKNQITINATPDGRSLIKDYLTRYKDTDALKLFEEFRNGDGPENSLFIGNHPMNLDIINSPDFIKLKKDYYQETAFNDKKALGNTFGLVGAYRAGTDLTSQFIGKFDVSFYPLGDNVIVLVTDSKTQNSLKPWLKIPSWFGKKYEEFGNVSRSVPSYSENNDYTSTRQSYLFVLPKSSFRE